MSSFYFYCYLTHCRTNKPSDLGPKWYTNLFRCNAEHTLHLFLALELKESIRTHCSGETKTIIVTKKESIRTHSSGDSKNYIRACPLRQRHSINSLQWVITSTVLQYAELKCCKAYGFKYYIDKTPTINHRVKFKIQHWTVLNLFYERMLR